VTLDYFALRNKDFEINDFLRDVEVKTKEN
jgi:hypothetical protein